MLVCLSLGGFPGKERIMNSPNQWQQEETEYQVQGVRREQARAMQSRRFNHSRSGGPCGIDQRHPPPPQQALVVVNGSGTRPTCVWRLLDGGWLNRASSCA
jgi:hypothetical protein